MSAKNKASTARKENPEDRAKRLDPDRLELYKRTLEIRKAIGLVSPTATEILRELRGYDD